MNDWRSKLEGLNQDLQSKERQEVEAKAAVLTGFRKLLLELEKVAQDAIAFGDAFGVDCEWSMDRFHDRYPKFQFVIRRPALSYAVECKDGVIYELLKQGDGPVKRSTTTLKALAPKSFEKRIGGWVQAAADANRTVRPKRK